jgi:hypothetical protein
MMSCRDRIMSKRNDVNSLPPKRQEELISLGPTGYKVKLMLCLLSQINLVSPSTGLKHPIHFLLVIPEPHPLPVVLASL